MQRWRITRARALVLATCMVACSDGAQQDMRLRAVSLWKGAANCVGCRSTALDILHATDTRLVLERDSTYTVAVELDVGERLDRCIYRIVTASWIRNDLPREFACTLPEATMLREFRSPAGSTALPGALLSVAVDEYDSTTRTRVAGHFSKVFTVDWQ